MGKGRAKTTSEGIVKTIGKILLVRRAALCRGMGVLEKTDRIDAGMIAWYEQVKQVRPTEPASPQQAHLQALVVRLRQLTDVQTQQRQQARLVTDQVVLAGYSTLLGLVAAQIRSLEAAKCEISCTSSRAWCASTIPILPPSMPPSAPQANRRK